MIFDDFCIFFGIDFLRTLSLLLPCVWRAFQSPGRLMLAHSWSGSTETSRSSSSWSWYPTSCFKKHRLGGWLVGWCLQYKFHPINITKLKRFQVIPAANKCYSKVSGETTSLPIQVDTQRGYLPRDTSIAEPGRSLLVLAPSSSTCTWKAWFSSTQGTWWIHDMTKTTVHFPPPHLQLCGSVVLPKAKKLLQFWGVQRNEILTAKVMPILQILWLSWQKEA